MESVQKEMMLYGLENHQNAIDQIIQELHIDDFAFDVRLLLVEAVLNAYQHGNRCDCEKPIFVRYSLKDRLLRIEVQDCGDGSANVCIPEELDCAKLLDEGGRGLYLIRCYSDSVVMIHNTLYIDKTLFLGN